MFNEFRTRNKDYTAKYRSLSFNLKKNSQLVEMLLRGEVSGDQLIHMTAEELAHEELKKLVFQLKRADLYVNANDVGRERNGGRKRLLKSQHK